jgi:GNAT superfamily N-acetyltransferase
VSPIEVVSAPDLAEPLSLLEESLRDGEPVPEAFAIRLRKSIETGDIEVLAARTKDRTLGVAILAYRLNISAGGLFASIEDLYVRPEARRQGVGKALLKQQMNVAQHTKFLTLKYRSKTKRPKRSTRLSALGRRKACVSSPAL